jgi:hypothetical protein
VKALVNYEIPGSLENETRAAVPRFQFERLLGSSVFQGVKTDFKHPAGKGIHVLLESQDAFLNDIVLTRDDSQLSVFDLMNDRARYGISGRGCFRMNRRGQADAKAQTWRNRRADAVDCAESVCFAFPSYPGENANTWWST